MAMRVASLDEYQFLICLKNKVWGSEHRMTKWLPGDGLLLLVGKKIAGLAIVRSKMYESNDLIWDNGLFPYRVSLEFVRAFDRDKRPSSELVMDIILKSWGKNYGWGIVTKASLSDSATNEIFRRIENIPNETKEFISRVDDAIIFAIAERNAEYSEFPNRNRRKYKSATIDISS